MLEKRFLPLKVSEMDEITRLVAIVQLEVEDYARGGDWKAYTYPVSDTVRQHYAVLIFPDYPRKYRAAIIVAARVVDDVVIIDEDITDRPLWKELMRAGIPREKIILTYIGEQIPAKEA
jgi:hypothetical protein